MPELNALMTGISFGEQPRWHEGRLFFSDWGTREVIAIDLEGRSEVVLRAPAGAVWYGDVPDKRCVRVREGAEVMEEIDLDRGCFACALGGADRETLFMIATEWNGPASMFGEPRTGQVLTAQAPAPGVGWP